MIIAVTGATGFLGRYIVNYLTREGSTCRCWYRPESDRGGFECTERIEWVPGSLEEPDSAARLVAGCEAVVHAALYRPGAGWRGAEGDVLTFAERNVLGTLRLIDAARRAGTERFVFISTCAVHEVILDDRPLDETHPTCPTSHYGAHKAAIEQFVYSFGLGEGYDICAIRPTGIYGIARPATGSKWYDLVRSVQRGEPVRSPRGGKEVHAEDVAQAVAVVLRAAGTAGHVYNCYDRYIADQDVARIARELCGGTSEIAQLNKGPKHQIDTSKLRALGVTFGGEQRLVATVRALLDA